jgi:4a-hydroxytetrahydrobiopterin dehydratase
MGLSEQECIPCKGGIPPLTEQERGPLLEMLGGGWEVVDGHHLHKNYTFDDFAKALAFTNLIGAIAEQQWHHPDILLKWGSVGVDIWTHKIDGLVESDFVLAAKFDDV